MEKLTKAAIIESLHAKLGVNRSDIHAVIDELFEEIKDGLKDNRIIELRGFGTFEVRIRRHVIQRQAMLSLSIGMELQSSALVRS